MKRHSAGKNEIFLTGIGLYYPGQTALQMYPSEQTLANIYAATALLEVRPFFLRANIQVPVH